MLYAVNSLGDAAFVLVAGFGLIPAFGLPGALVVAAVLNVAAAIGAGAAGRSFAKPVEARPATLSLRVDDVRGLSRVLLGAAALTAVASFAYQIGWIRMLSLVMGSATHSFEIMLSAFILGLALGALWIRGRADADRRPIRTLARIQWAMGLLALATLPIYTASFGWSGDLVAALPETDAGYRIFSLAKYGVALAVMLPATVLAALHQAFPSYAAYLVGDTDVMIVAGVAQRLPEPDWSLLADPSLATEIRHLPPLRGDHLEGLKLFERGDLDPLFPGWLPPNSDFAPILDTRSERARFTDSFAHGFFGLALDRFQIAAALGGWRRAPATSFGAPMPGLAPITLRADALAARVWLAEPFAPPSRGARPAVRAIGTAFFTRTRETLERGKPPPVVLAVVDFTEGLAGWDFELAARASGTLEAWILRESAAAAEGELLESLDRGLLLDGRVVALLKTGRVAEALERLGPLAQRGANDFRMALLRATSPRSGRARERSRGGSKEPHSDCSVLPPALAGECNGRLRKGVLSPDKALVCLMNRSLVHDRTKRHRRRRDAHERYLVCDLKRDLLVGAFCSDTL